MAHRQGSFPTSRRAFIALLGGTAVACPLAARAQQGGRMRRIGVLSGNAEDDAIGQAQLADEALKKHEQ